MKKILITGSAGFIGFHLSNILVKDDYQVVGLDILNDYYDINLKNSRLIQLGINTSNIDLNKVIESENFKNFKFVKADIADSEFIKSFMFEQKFDYVVNLAAQAGVRYSLENPHAYTYSNIEGFLNILEGCRHNLVKHLIYASTSSVYGLNETMPLCEDTSTEHPISLYAATKKANEMMAHSYSHLFNLPTTGLRFFTVYGPWGRPDMALFLFTKSIIDDKPIKVFNNGKMIRDFTFVLDIVHSIQKLIPKAPQGDKNWTGKSPKPNKSSAPYQIFNIGNSSPTNLLDYISAIELALNKKAFIEYLPMQPGDVPMTHSSTINLEKYIDFKPTTKIEDGIRDFVNWYRLYNNVKS